MTDGPGGGDVLVEVHVTTPDAGTASRLARTLVAEGLAACVQVLPGVTSHYTWEGALETSEEHLLLVKSTASRFEAIRRWVRAEHPYEVPEVLAVPVVAVDTEYEAWLRTAVADRAPRGSGQERGGSR